MVVIADGGGGMLPLMVVRTLVATCPYGNSTMRGRQIERERERDTEERTEGNITTTREGEREREREVDGERDRERDPPALSYTRAIT